MCSARSSISSSASVAGRSLNASSAERTLRTPVQFARAAMIGARHRERFLLPPGRDLGRVCPAGADLLRYAIQFGRRWAMIIPALLAIPVAPLYLLSTDMFWIAVGFVIKGMCGGGGMQGQCRLISQSVSRPRVALGVEVSIQRTFVARATLLNAALGTVPAK